MATIVTVTTDKSPPPKGSSRRNRLIANLQAVIQADLGDPSVVVNIEKV